MEPFHVLRIAGIALITVGFPIGARVAKHLYGRDAGCATSVTTVVLGIAALIASWIWQIVLTRRRRAVYASAFGREQATIHMGRSVEDDRIDLPGPPCPASIRFHHLRDNRQRPYTEFIASCPERPGALRISSPEQHALLNQYYGGRDVIIGDAEFDHRFLIQSNPIEMAADYLDGRSREAIRELNRHGREPFLLQIRPGHLLVRVPTRIQQGADLSRFIGLCYELVMRLGVSMPAGVTLDEAVLTGEARCPVCGTHIEDGRRVACRKCATPHHAECWAYNDGCSTFACGGRRMRRSR
jgi:Prokaryotic RING finger family 1